MSSLRYIGKRFILSVLTIILVTIITFVLTQVVPGDVAYVILGKDATEEGLEAVRQQLGLNRPIYIQYLDWLFGFVTGDLGHSFVYEIPVKTLLAQRLPRSIYLAVAALTVAVLSAIPLGVIASVRQNEPIDNTVSALTFAGISVPNFFWGLVFILIFAAYFDILPPSGYVSPGKNFSAFLRHLIMPALALAWSLMAYITRMMRSSMLDEYSENYITTAKAKGVSQRNIVYKHAFRNALIPVLTIIAIQLGYAFGGVVIIEEVFSWPGIGSLAFDAIQHRDLPVLQAAVVIISAVFVGANFTVDILYGIIDPRIRYGGDNE